MNACLYRLYALRKYTFYVGIGQVQNGFLYIHCKISIILMVCKTIFVRTVVKLSLPEEIAVLRVIAITCPLPTL